MTQPIAGAFYGEGSTISVAAAASDGDGSVVRVEFLDGTAVVGAATAAPFAISWTGALAGDHAIAARAIDDKGAATVSAPVGITIGEAPLVVVKGPLACSVVDAGAALVLNADAISTHGSIASVEFFDNGTSVGTAFTDPGPSHSSQPTAGSHIDHRARNGRSWSRSAIAGCGDHGRPGKPAADRNDHLAARRIAVRKWIPRKPDRGRKRCRRVRLGRRIQAQRQRRHPGRSIDEPTLSRDVARRERGLVRDRRRRHRRPRGQKRHRPRCTSRSTPMLRRP